MSHGFSKERCRGTLFATKPWSGVRRLVKMDPNQEIDDLDLYRDEPEAEDSISVDDFIRELEAKEKDLHITLETTVIEIEQGFDDVNPSVYKAPEGPSKSDPAPQQPPEPAESPSVATVGDEELEAEDLEEDDYGQVEELVEQIDGLKDEIAVMKKTIERLESERLEISENSQRRARDFAAYKSRTERERDEFRKNEAGDLVLKLLPSIDNLGRALDFAAGIPREKSTEFSQFFEGIKMVGRQIDETFASMGVEPILAVGQLFDPYLHEAVATEEDTDLPENTVCEELMKGYKIGDRILRHSMVKVAVAAPALRPDPDTSVGDDVSEQADENNEQRVENDRAVPETEYEIEIFSNHEDVRGTEQIPSPEAELDTLQDFHNLPDEKSE